MNAVAVVPYQPAIEAYGARSLTAADIRAQVNLIQDVMLEVMKEGVHYGKIPGTNGKSLWKPGAEKLAATFRLSAKPRVEDLSQGGEIHYRLFVALVAKDGTFVGEGVGECSSQEEKYSWRKASHAKEYDATPENRRRIKFDKEGKETKQVRTNPWDVANTILKMAKKRAQVDAVITATAAGDIFTQDIEDLPEEVLAEIVGKTPPRSTSKLADQPLPDYSDADFKKNLPTWRGLIEAGKKSADDLIAMLQTKAKFTPEQIKAIRGETATEAAAPALNAVAEPEVDPPRDTSEPNDYWPEGS